MNKQKTKRLRIFAGPNGSGKSTLAANLPKKNISLGIFVNADEIEFDLKNKGCLSLSKYKFISNTEKLREYIIELGMTPTILNNSSIDTLFEIRYNRIYFSGNYNSYVAADIAGFIRTQLLKTRENFSIETVFSHESKLQFMKDARDLGYRVYLYFITTDDPIININRVNIRVAKKGHHVTPKKITDRYYRSLNLLIDAVKLSNRAYLFDNSGKYYELVAEITNGKKVEVLDFDGIIPNWFVNHVYNKARDL